MQWIQLNRQKQMKQQIKSHTLILVLTALSGCASTVDPGPELMVRYYYAPMQYHGIQAQESKPTTQPTSQPRQMILNTAGRAVGYIK
jgi:hypothetical protein